MFRSLRVIPYEFIYFLLEDTSNQTYYQAIGFSLINMRSGTKYSYKVDHCCTGEGGFDCGFQIGQGFLEEHIKQGF